ncbi:MAG: Mu transposase C-terminal domain-containing protein [Propionicimonas sp.]
MNARVSPRGVLHLGDQVRFDGGEHTVVGLAGTVVRLAGDDGVCRLVTVAHLQADGDFLLLSGAAPVSLTGLGLLDGVSPAAVERARWWELHVLEVEVGLPPDADAGAEPRPGYDPACYTLAQREQAKADELCALGEQVSRATVRRKRGAYAESGLWGLVDNRSTKPTTQVGRIDPRVVGATRRAMAEEIPKSTGTRTRLRRRVEQLLVEEHGPDEVVMPARTTFYRLLAGLDPGMHSFGPATTRRSLANRPEGPFGSVAAARPGELVQIDTTPLDVMAFIDDGVVGRVELTTMVDLATRSICAAVLRPHGTKGIDAALLMARALVPEPMRPGWPEALRLQASRLPVELAQIDQRLADAAAKPVIVPETIVCDRGAVFLSATFVAACAQLGITVQPSHPRTPTDKAVVERTYSSINTLFCQYVAGYTGRDVVRRGERVEAGQLWSIEELQDLLDEWVVACWQPRPHDGLRHPDLPRHALSPNEMYAALVASAGYVPLALSGQDYLELLPVAWRRITAEGIRLGYLTYDSPELNAYRGQRSGVAAMSGRWEVHHDPYDLSRIWVRLDDGALTSVAWIHHNRTLPPFADYTLRHVRKQLAARSADPDQASIARALDDLLTRAETGPVDGDLTTRRVIARTRAAAANPVLPALEDEPGPGQASGTDGGADAAAADDEIEATVIPFGVFSARAEAERFW